MGFLVKVRTSETLIIILLSSSIDKIVRNIVKSVKRVVLQENYMTIFRCTKKIGFYVQKFIHILTFLFHLKFLSLEVSSSLLTREQFLFLRVSKESTFKA